MDKSERQRLGVSRLIEAGGIGIFDYVPRFGKTITALKATSALLSLNNTNTKKILIVSPNEVLVSQWKNSIDTYNTTCLYEHKINEYHITTIFKLAKHHKEVETNWAVIIYDEIHNYTTDDRFEILISNTTKSRFKIGLTGTMPTGELRKKLVNILPVVDVITESEAIENKWISEYVEYNIPLEFTIGEKSAYRKYSEYITETLNLFKDSHYMLRNRYFTSRVGDKTIRFSLNFNNEYDVIKACNKGYFNTDTKTYIHADTVCKALAVVKGYSRDLNINIELNKQIVDTWHPEAIAKTTNKFTVFVDNRNFIMSDSYTKIDYIIDIISDNTDKTIIIFMGSINSAEKLTTSINNKFGNIALAYHSKVKSTYMYDSNNNVIRYKNGKPKLFGATGLKKYAIESLKNGNIKILVTVNALNEGLDIPNINLLITAFGTTNPITHLQRTARAKTYNTKNPEKVVIINLFFDDFYVDDNLVYSRDKVKLYMRQEATESNPVLISSAKDIFFD